MKLLSPISQKISKFLKTPYKPLKKQISFKLIPVVACLPFTGFIYLVLYLEEFGIAYETLYFNVNDCIAILYEKGILFYLVAMLLAGASFAILINFTKEDLEKITFKNYEILIISSCFLFLLILFLYQLKMIPYEGVFYLSPVLAIAVWLYLFKSDIGGIILAFAFFTAFCFVYSATDAKKRKKEKPTFDIILKDDEKPMKILSETDTCRYFIRKTSDYIFIMDYCKNKVITYPVSDLKSTSFTPKNN